MRNEPTRSPGARTNKYPRSNSACWAGCSQADLLSLFLSEDKIPYRLKLLITTKNIPWRMTSKMFTEYRKYYLNMAFALVSIQDLVCPVLSLKVTSNYSRAGKNNWNSTPALLFSQSISLCTHFLSLPVFADFSTLGRLQPKVTESSNSEWCHPSNLDY